MYNKEYEKKALITLDVYLQLVNLLSEKSFCENILQVNYYYDNDKFDLLAKHETLRVRQIINELKLEKKYNTVCLPSGERVCDEYSENIKTLPKTIALEDGIYGYIGNMITLRKNYNINNNLISLDVSYYLGNVDWEIEVESDSRIQIPKFISDIVVFKNDTKGKYNRFVSKLLEMNKCYGN